MKKPNSPSAAPKPTRAATVLAIATCLMFPVGLLAQDKVSEGAEGAAPVLTPEQAAVAEQANAYMAAYNKGDLKALATMFAEDAEWVDDEGNVHTGREAIIATLKGAMQGSKGRVLDIDVESVRSLTPDVLVEKGTSTVTEADGRNAVSSYTAVHVKNGDKWVISEFTETASPQAGTAARRLAELDWLIGSWVHTSEGRSMKTKVEWAANQNFLTRSFSLDQDESTGTEVIGWDPSIGKIRSWIFESDGSFTERAWTQDGRRWLIKSRTVLADGGLGSEEQTLTQSDKDKFTWSSASRVVDGETLPNLEAITIVRAK